MNFQIGDFGYFEFNTGNGLKKHNEWSSHYVKGFYEVVKIEGEKVYLKEENIIFPVMRDKITKFEKK